MWLDQRASKTHCIHLVYNKEEEGGGRHNHNMFLLELIHFNLYHMKIGDLYPHTMRLLARLISRL
jgi:hypothetical protein